MRERTQLIARECICLCVYANQNVVGYGGEAEMCSIKKEREDHLFEVSITVGTVDMVEHNV